MSIPYNHIRGFVIGRKAQVIRVPVLDIADTRIIHRAWFTIKANETDSDADALLIKEIGDTDLDGTHGIIDTDDDSQVRLIFNLMPDDWTTMGIEEGTFYFYDINVEETDADLSDPDIYDVELGDFMGIGPIYIDPS